MTTGHFINNELGVAVLIVEYQGYTVLKEILRPAKLLQIRRLSWNVPFKYGYEPKDIMLFGRSIGGAFAF